VPGFRFTSLEQVQTVIPGRTDRIAHCRNRYLQEIPGETDYRDVDYVVVADLDSINGLISTEAFESPVLSATIGTSVPPTSAGQTRHLIVPARD
jgi:hypothetical protein